MPGQKTAKGAGPGGIPSVPVTLGTAASESVPVEIRVVGTVEPSATVQVKSQIAGELTAVHFTEGQNVEKGDLLFEIDPRPYEDALRQAEAAVARDRAQIAQVGGHAGARCRPVEIRRYRRRPLRRTAERRPHFEIAIRPIAHQRGCPERESIRADRGHHR